MSWQQVMPGELGIEASICNGISNLEQVLKQIHVQHSIVVGICFSLFSSSRQNTASDILVQLVAVDASFVRLKDQMEVLSTLVNPADDVWTRYQKSNPMPTSGSTKTP